MKICTCATDCPVVCAYCPYMYDNDIICSDGEKIEHIVKGSKDV